MVRKAWARKVPASVGLALLIELKKEKPGGGEVSRLCVPGRRVGNCCCDTSPTSNNPSQRVTRPCTVAGNNPESQVRACERLPSLSQCGLGLLPNHWPVVFTEPKHVLAWEPV